MQAHPKADLSVPALAERMAMSPRNFSRLFHRETELTPAQFAEQVRADAARCKLEQTFLPISPSPRNAGSLIPSACGARFNAFSTPAQPITGHDFDQPSEPNSTIVRAAKPPPEQGARRKRPCDNQSARCTSLFAASSLSSQNGAVTTFPRLRRS